jgi:pimeloyl-ACP methyl ester carboxylesterase
MKTGTGFTISGATGPITVLLALALGVAAAQAADATARARLVAPAEARGAQRLIEVTAVHPKPARLPSELDIPELADLARSWAQLPKTTRLFRTVRNGVPAHMAAHLVGSQTNTEVRVCLHGIASQSENWKYVAGALGDKYDLWLIDLPGCGASDSPDPKAMGPGGYSPAGMGERVLQVLEALQAERPQPVRLLIVAHSFGGMIALRMFADDDLRRRHNVLFSSVNGLVLFAPCDVFTQSTETWRTVLGLNGFKVFAGNTLGLLPRAMEDSLRSAYRNPALVSREQFDQGMRQLVHSQDRAVMKAMLSQAIPWRVFNKVPDHEVLHALEAGYKNVSVPCLIAWGHCDETLLLGMGHKLKDELPDARLVIVPETKHWLQLERPRICARLICQFADQLAHGTTTAARSVETLDLRPGETLLAGSKIQ